MDSEHHQWTEWDLIMNDSMDDHGGFLIDCPLPGF